MLVASNEKLRIGSLLGGRKRRVWHRKIYADKDQISLAINLLMTLIGFSRNVITSDVWRLADTGMLPNYI